MAERRVGRAERGAFAPRLVILAKSPRLGRVKRRLAADIGGTEAIRFYRACLGHAAMRLFCDRRWQTLLAVTPDGDMAAPVWPGGRAGRMARLPQGHGDLGARMQALFGRLPPGPVVIIGSDIPGIARGDIARAFKLLGRADAVLGPAEDGGYWLIGLKRRPRLVRPFPGVRWSSPQALADTLANLDGAGALVAFACSLRDVDDGESYRALGADWQRLIPPRPWA